LSSATSSTSSKRPKRGKQKRQQQQQHQYEEKKISKWPTVLSVMIVPVMFAAWGASDWVFGNRTKGHNEELRQKFLAEQHRHHPNSHEDSDDYLSSLETKPTLFHCVIRQSTGLTHCVSGVQLGDVVEVLEEGVGPDRAYNLCRLPAKAQSSLSTDSYGWFPIRWSQKLDHYESMVQEQLRNLSKDDAE